MNDNEDSLSLVETVAQGSKGEFGSDEFVN